MKHTPTLRAGALYEAGQTAQSQHPVPTEITVTSAEQQVMSLDGVHVPLVGGAWAEVRTIAIGEIQEERTQQDSARCTPATCPTFLV